MSVMETWVMDVSPLLPPALSLFLFDSHGTYESSLKCFVALDWI